MNSTNQFSEASSRAAVLSANAMLLRTGKYSDLTLKCRSKVFKLHRSIVSPRSKPFEAMLDSIFKEAITGTIELEDDELEVVERMIDFIYTDSYCDNTTIGTAVGSSQKAPGVPQSLLLNTKIYIIADKYDIQILKLYAVKKYSEALPREGLTSSFSSSLRLMYEQTLENDRLLKDRAKSFARDHYRILANKEEFQALCKEIGEVAADVLKALADLPSFNKPCARIPPCGKKDIWVSPSPP